MSSVTSLTQSTAVLSKDHQTIPTQERSALKFPNDIYYQKKKAPRPPGHGEAWDLVLEQLQLTRGEMYNRLEERGGQAPYDLVTKDGIPSWGSIIYLAIHRAELIGEPGLLGKDISNIGLALYPSLNPNNDSVRHALTTNHKFTRTDKSPINIPTGGSGALWRIATRVEVEKKKEEDKARAKAKLMVNNGLNQPKPAKGVRELKDEADPKPNIMSMKRKVSVTEHEAGEGKEPVPGDGLELIPAKRIKFETPIASHKPQSSLSIYKARPQKSIKQLNPNPATLQIPTPPITPVISKSKLGTCGSSPIIKNGSTKSVDQTITTTSKSLAPVITQKKIEQSKQRVTRSGRKTKATSKTSVGQPIILPKTTLKKTTKKVYYGPKEIQIAIENRRKEEDNIMKLPEDHAERQKLEAFRKYQRELQERQAEFPAPDQLANDDDDPIPEWCEQRRKQRAADAAAWHEGVKEEARRRKVEEHPEYLERRRMLDRIESYRQAFLERGRQEQENKKAERKFERVPEILKLDLKSADGTTTERIAEQEPILAEQHATWEEECKSRAKMNSIRREEIRAVNKFLANPELKKHNIHVSYATVTQILPSSHPYLQN